MSLKLVPYLCSIPILKVIKSLAGSSRPRYLRDLAKEHDISPAGMADILRRLKEAGVLRETRSANKKYVSLKLSLEELEALGAIFKLSEYADLERRARRFSKGALNKLQSMDEALEFYRGVKGRR